MPDQAKPIDTSLPRGLTRDLLCLLLAARDGLSTEDLAEVLDVPQAQIQDCVAAAADLLADATLVELRRPIAFSASEFSPADIALARERMLAWARRFAAEGWPDSTPGYVLKHHAADLSEAGENHDLYQLISPRWMELRLASGSPAAFGRDAHLAFQAAALEQPPDIAQQLRCALVSAGLKSFVADVSPDVVGLLAETGDAGRALEFAALMPDAVQRSDAYSQIASVLLRDDKTREAKDAAYRAFTAMRQAAGQIGPRISEQVAAGITRALAETGQTDRAREAADLAFQIAGAAEPTVMGISYRLMTAAEAFMAAGLAEKAMSLAEGVEQGQPVLDDSDKGSTLTGIALAFARAGLTDQAVQLAEKIGYDLAATFDCLHDMGSAHRGPAHPPGPQAGRHLAGRRAVCGRRGGR